MTVGTIGYHPASPMDLRLLPYQPNRDVYRLLGVTPSAGRAEIVAACRRLARAFHPDRNASQRATEEMQVVNAVRSLLIDPSSRAEYDRARWIFWAATPRPRAAAPMHSSRPTWAAAAEPRGRSHLSRAARAAMAGLLVGWRPLSPPRCARCNASAQPDFRFCGDCGAPLAATQRLSAG